MRQVPRDILRQGEIFILERCNMFFLNNGKPQAESDDIQSIHDTKNFSKMHFFYSFLVILGLYFSLYLFNNWFHFFPVTQLTPTLIDHWIEFNPLGIYFYLAAYLFPLFALFRLLKIGQKGHCIFFLKHFLCVTLIANVIFFLFPTSIDNPMTQWDYKALSNQSDWFTAFWLKLIYTADRPYNCLPSLHVAATFVGAFALGIERKRIMYYGAIAVALCISYSTLQIKQHLFYDVFAGFLLALITGFLLRKFQKT